MRYYYYKVILPEGAQYVKTNTVHMIAFMLGTPCQVIPLGTHKPKNVSRETIKELIITEGD